MHGERWVRRDSEPKPNIQSRLNLTFWTFLCIKLSENIPKVLVDMFKSSERRFAYCLYFKQFHVYFHEKSCSLLNNTTLRRSIFFLQRRITEDNMICTFNHRIKNKLYCFYWHSLYLRNKNMGTGVQNIPYYLDWNIFNIYNWFLLFFYLFQYYARDPVQ